MLRVENLSVVFNGRRVLKDVSCNLGSNEVMLIAGPNGSGKSTLLRAVMGLVDCDGRIMLDDRDISNLKPFERYRLGITLAPERMRVAANLTVEENLAIAGDVAEAFELFPELKILADKKAGKLSGGERQMVVLARAFISNPKYLLLDEPFNGLYSDVRKRVLDYIESLPGGLMIVTHDEIEDVFSMSDKTCILTGGEVLYFGESVGAERIIRKLFI